MPKITYEIRFADHSIYRTLTGQPAVRFIKKLRNEEIVQFNEDRLLLIRELRLV